jgi:uncharacterized Zn-binding protein involved in type VI secretion
MAIGYFIRLGDKTTCGGVVMEAETRAVLYGIAQACEGHQVTCGIDGNTYRIVGGVSYMLVHGKLAAGTLDSFSSCPCKARLLATLFDASYGSADSPAPRAAHTATQSPNWPDRTFAASHSASASRLTAAPSNPSATPAVCDQRFLVVDHQHQPLCALDYVLLQGNQCIAYGKSDNQGHSASQTSSTPVSLNLATRAPSPAME